MRDWRDSNPRPLGPQPNALSTELQPPGSLYSLTIITNSNLDCKLVAQARHSPAMEAIGQTTPATSAQLVASANGNLRAK